MSVQSSRPQLRGAQLAVQPAQHPVPVSRNQHPVSNFHHSTPPSTASATEGTPTLHHSTTPTLQHSINPSIHHSTPICCGVSNFTFWRGFCGCIFCHALRNSLQSRSLQCLCSHN